MVDEGFSTRERESMALNGSDWEENHEQRVKEERMRRAGGLADMPGSPARSRREPPDEADAREEAA
jgi:hypothetical protein